MFCSFTFRFCIFVFITLILNNCSDEVLFSKNADKKSVLGSVCQEGCIWSRYAVTSGVQKLTHYCDGVGCHCVEIGNIYNSCRDSSEDLLESNVQNTTISFDYNAYKGQQIADEAYYEASTRRTYGWCYNAVADAVERITGPFLWGQHAYQAADQFANNNNFYEIYNYDLNNLPLGAIVVWGKGNSRSGHISISIGNNKEASDHIANQMTYHYGGAKARVFYPK